MTDPVETDGQPFLDQLKDDARRIASTVDTEALRKLAAECNENNYNADNGWLLGSSGDALNAAADEVDRLWNNLHDRENEADRLRTVIENAPHAASCYVAIGAPEGPCDCWKADAL